MDPVRFGLIGCGAAGYFHVLASRYKPNPIHEFVAVHDINEDVLKRFSKRYRLASFDKLDDFLSYDFDVALIAAPHYLHADLTMKAAEAGKHVLCEKPMATTLEECDTMIAATQRAGVKFMIAENHRFLPAHKLIKDSVQAGLIGDVFLGRAYEGAFVPRDTFLDANNWQFTFDKGGGGVVADQGVHKFTILNWLLGEVDSAICWLSKTIPSPPSKAEDNAIILLRYKNGAMITVDVSSTTVHPLTNRLELHGTKGTILEDHAWEQPMQIFSSHDAAEKKGEFYSPKIEHGPYPAYYIISAFYEDSHFAECVQKKQDPDFTPTEAREAIAITLLAYLSAKTGTKATRDDLNELQANHDTKSILQGLDGAIQNNYTQINWD